MMIVIKMFSRISFSASLYVMLCPSAGFVNPPANEYDLPNPAAVRTWSANVIVSLSVLVIPPADDADVHEYSMSPA